MKSRGTYSSRKYPSTVVSERSASEKGKTQTTAMMTAAPPEAKPSVQKFLGKRKHYTSSFFLVRYICPSPLSLPSTIAKNKKKTIKNKKKKVDRKIYRRKLRENLLFSRPLLLPFTVFQHKHCTNKKNYGLIRYF